MASVSKSFGEVASGSTLPVRHGESFAYSVSGTFDGTVVLEKSVSGGQTWEAIATASGAASGVVQIETADRSPAVVRFRCSAYTSGTIVTVVRNSLSVSAKKQLFAAGAKAGTTSGFVVGAADNISLITCPQSKTASTLVIPLNGLKVGDTITGFHVVGQVESAGGAVTVDAALRKHTAAAADVADASVAAITQVSVTADAILSATNAGTYGFDEVVGEDESFYILITATTAASTDIALQGVSVAVVEGA